MITESFADIPWDETVLTIHGQNFDPVGSQVELTLATTTSITCDVIRATTSTIECAVSLPQIQGSLQAVVIAHSGRSAPAVVATVVDPASAVQGIGGGALAGIIIAVVVVAVLATILVLLLIRRRKQQKKMEEMQRLFQVSDEFSGLFNIKSSEIHLISKLGEGAYGGTTKFASY